MKGRTFRALLLFAVFLFFTSLLIGNVQGIWSIISSPTISGAHDMYLLSSTDGWTVGDGGKILRWNGVSWSTVASPTTDLLRGVFAVSSDDAWVVGGSLGSHGTILRWNGVSWSTVATPTPEAGQTRFLLSKVSMVNSNDGWIVGYGGWIMHWNGVSWSTFASPTTTDLECVYMVNSNDGWAGGGSGKILRWNGGSWSTFTSPTTSFLWDIFMVNSNDGWAGCSSGTILRWNGVSWSTVATPTTAAIFGIHMINSNDGWAATSQGEILHWNGVSWSTVATPTTDRLMEIYMISSTEGWAVGDDGLLQWTVIPPIADFTFSPSTVEKDQTVSFTASASSDPDGSITDWSWDFGDGGTGSGETTSHSYNSADTYTVELTVTDDDDLTDTTTKTITIGGGIQPTELTASVSPTSKTLNAGQQATFTVTATGGTAPYTYQWYEGTSPISGETNSQLTITKNTADTYTYYCKVTDNEQHTVNSNTATLTVTTEPPQLTGSIKIENDADSTDTTAITLNLMVDDSTSIAEMHFSNDGSTWSDWQDYSTTASWTLTEGDGTKTVYVQFRDNEGEISSTYSDTITLTTAPSEPFPLWIIAPIAAVVIAAVVVFFLLKKRKPKEKVPKPTKIRVTVNPNELLADGKSTASMIIELLDSEGNPVSAVDDTEIKLTSTMGEIEKPVAKIPKGKEKAQSLLVSSKQPGTVTLSADAKGLKGTSITVAFSEKKRYCMHCGFRMTITEKRCQKCGKIPPSGVDTKICEKCNSVIPATANYCSECGSSQS
jgi:PKD repeat protein/ribosomal protein L40E